MEHTVAIWYVCASVAALAVGLCTAWHIPQHGEPPLSHGGNTSSCRTYPITVQRKMAGHDLLRQQKKTFLCKSHLQTALYRLCNANPLCWPYVHTGFNNPALLCVGKALVQARYNKSADRPSKIPRLYATDDSNTKGVQHARAQTSFFLMCVVHTKGKRNNASCTTEMHGGTKHTCKGTRGAKSVLCRRQSLGYSVYRRETA